MMLSSLLNLKDGDVVSITGAGGKTTLMFTIANELRRDKKVFISTTTKIYVPRKEEYDFMTLDEEELKKMASENNNGIYVFGTTVNDEGKLLGISRELPNLISSEFDIAVLEADGSRGKAIKGWNSNEPVISNGTTKTIGVLSIENLGCIINEQNVHRLEEFLRISNGKIGDNISIENLVAIIFNSEGLFKSSEGERILFLNKVETKEQEDLALCLIKQVNQKNHGFISKIIYGSLKNKNYVQF